jgi:hypothetical protein
VCVVCGGEGLRGNTLPTSDGQTRGPDAATTAAMAGSDTWAIDTDTLTHLCSQSLWHHMTWPSVIVGCCRVRVQGAQWHAESADIPPEPGMQMLTALPVCVLCRRAVSALRWTSAACACGWCVAAGRASWRRRHGAYLSASSASQGWRGREGRTQPQPCQRTVSPGFQHMLAPVSIGPVAEDIRMCCIS